jgi:hypothetical protein
MTLKFFFFFCFFCEWHDVESSFANDKTKMHEAVVYGREIESKNKSCHTSKKIHVIIQQKAHVRERERYFLLSYIKNRRLCCLCDVQREREKEIWGDMQRAPREDAEKAGALETRPKKKKNKVKKPATQAISTKLPHSFNKQAETLTLSFIFSL